MTELQDRLAVTLVDRYVLERELGHGGMATVFLARDLKHDRSIALKVLHPELGAVLGAERFQREIKTAARLHHPHILQLYDSGEAAGLLYYTMPLVEGESLRQRLDREQRLSVPAALSVAREVASALDYAHRHGVVHRDIKPENVLLTDGGALVADFGIARAVGAAGGEHLTQTGLLVGTPAYMSPEQAAGGDIAAGSDQYSLACVVYEMLVGEPLFTGLTPQAVMAARFRQPAPPMERLPPEVGASATQVLARALATEPIDRFPSASDFVEALDQAAAEARPTKPARRSSRRAPSKRQLAVIGLATLVLLGVSWALRQQGSDTTLTPVDPNAIAVLPFRVANPAHTLWREGLVDLFATNLDGAAEWRTIHPRTALSRWHRVVEGEEGDQATLLSVAKALGAGYVLTGSLAGGAKVRLLVELLPTDGEGVRRAQAEGVADSIPGLVDQISFALIRERPEGDSSGVIPDISRATTSSLPALKAYLTGEQKFRRTRPRDAIPDFRRAVELDSSFALALYRLSAAEHWTLSPHDIGSDENLDRALRLGARLSRRDALLVRGTWESGRGWPEAFATLTELTRRYPEDAEAWFAYGDAHFHLAKAFLEPYDTFREALSRSIALDPGFGPSYLHLVEDAFERGDSIVARRYIEALERIDSASPKALGLRLAYDLVWGNEQVHREVREKLPGTSTDALITGKHGINFAPELAESTLVLARAIVDDPHRAIDDRINAEIGVLWAHFYRGRVRAALATADTIDRLAREAGPTSRFAFWAGADRWWPMFAFVGYGYTTDTAGVRQMARQVTQGIDYYWAGAVGARLRDPAIVKRSVDALTGYIDTTPAQGDSLEQVEHTRGNRVLGALVSGLLGLDAVFRGDSLRALRLLQAGADSMRANGQAGAFSTGPLDLEIGKLLLAKGDTKGAEQRFLSATDAPWQRVLADWYLGQAAEVAGDRAAAREYYGRVVRWWRDCDPELRPWLEEARQGMLRVTKEVASRN